MKIIRLISATAAAAALLPAWTDALAWGQKGHDTTAAIAERHLTPAAKAALDSLLDGKSIVYWSNWLDNASHTPEYAYTKTWHYKNIDAGVDYDKAPLLGTGDVVRAIPEQIAIAADPAASREQKQLAVKIIVHLLGDIHQPLHMGHASDLGGNRWQVKYFGRDAKLHSVWDSNLPESAHKWSYTEWVDQIDRATPQQQAEMVKGTPHDWGKETFKVCTDVYDQTPQDTQISYDYIAKWAPVVEQQFLKGGLRLADVLNSIFDSSYTPQSSAVKK